MDIQDSRNESSRVRNAEVTRNVGRRAQLQRSFVGCHSRRELKR